MNPFFNNFFRSLSSGELTRVNDILRSARVNSDKLDAISEALSSASFFNQIFAIPPTRRHTMARGDDVNNAMDTYDERIASLFTASNNIALLLDTYSSSLLSDISAIESELTGLEKAIGNYAFLLADAKSHDYAFLEPFSDLINQELESVFLSDRDKNHFTNEQIVALDSQEGSISISNSMKSTYALSASLVKNNYEPYKRSDSGIDKATLEDDKKGWRVSIASPAPIRSVLPEFEDLYAVPPSQYVGPLAVVDFVLDSPATCDTIKIIPFAEFEIELTQIVLFYGQEGQQQKSMLDNPVMIDSPVNLFFPMTSVSKFRVFLRQPLYTRVLPNANRREEDLAREGISVIVNQNQDKARLLEIMLNDLVAKIRSIHGGKSDTLMVSDIPLSKVKLTDVDSFEQFLYNIRYTAPKVIVTDDRPEPRIDRSVPWLPSKVPNPGIINSEVEKLINEMRKRLANLGYYRFGGNQTEADKSLDPNDKVVQPTTKGGGVAVGKAPEPMQYGYSMGLRNVIIGSGTQGFKAVYVSKILDAPSDLTDIKIKASDFNYKVENNQGDLQPVTSVEYSVTNDSNPTAESSWFPILSAEQSSVVGERLLLDSTGKAYFRFPASFDAPLTVLKNNEPLRLNPTNDYITSGAQHITGVVVPAQLISGTDIFTANYTPAFDATIVNFEKLGGASPSLASAYSSDGVGESITNAFGQLSVILSRVPYVNTDELGTLDPVLGLTGYQPVTIRFPDGSTARNFTDYKTNNNLPLDSDAEAYQFVQNGSAILFNKPLVQPIRAYYKYIPCNVRFRAVLRCNYPTFISPKVDYVHLKAKTRSLV